MENSIITVTGEKAISNKSTIGCLRNGVRILILLAMTILAYNSAVAQPKCAKDEKKVCKPTADGKALLAMKRKTRRITKFAKGLPVTIYVAAHLPR